MSIVTQKPYQPLDLSDRNTPLVDELGSPSSPSYEAKHGSSLLMQLVADYGVLSLDKMSAIGPIFDSFGQSKIAVSPKSVVPTSLGHSQTAIRPTTFSPTPSYTPDLFAPSPLFSTNKSKIDSRVLLSRCIGPITPPTTDDESSQAKEKSSDDMVVKEKDFATTSSDVRQSDSLSFEAELEKQPTTDGNFSDVFSFLRNHREKYNTLLKTNEQRRTPMTRSASQWEVPVEVEWTSTKASKKEKKNKKQESLLESVLAADRKSADETNVIDTDTARTTDSDGEGLKFKELSDSHRKDYFKNSDYVKKARDTSVRRPRGPITPSGNLSSSPSRPTHMLPLEAYLPSLKPRVIRAVEALAQSLPNVFPEEAHCLARYQHEPEAALGDQEGVVEWTDGVGKVVRDDTRLLPYVGYTGGVGSEKKGGVHLFLDHSNVYLSFLATLRDKATPNFPRSAKRTLSLPVLTLLLARGRSIKSGRMHLAGSSPMMQDLDPAVRLGWSCCILKRVPTDWEDDSRKSDSSFSAKKPGQKQGRNDRERDSSSDSDAHGNVATVSKRFDDSALMVKRNREQAVDEILQLKVLQTLLRNSAPGQGNQGTIVLATGDAKGGQFNEHGFLGCVREALKLGWKVELWAWDNGLSKAWAQVAEKENWTRDGKFVLWTFDHWLDELVEAK